jgi:mRNA-degrading endonuclease RelE of RelBE toxin-antitoxin system
MVYLIRPADNLEKKFVKFAKRNPAVYAQLMKKLEGISQNPYPYKSMRNVLKGNYRVHIGHFVLIYGVEESSKTIWLKGFDHHDIVYG